ncbi:uncharacterized protein LOC130654003 [Hydractinia symbiolongicarpus]|uniref:uncharacterized protein LOC130654003 n=1 Tax=Hydractinia symbiolongicarpus TaxID=13093 RepID=UPI00254D45ED|nr:uncharacterized protein LOC130654003 [Hydractinia symbiolongicarpus]
MALSKVRLAAMSECKICSNTYHQPKHLNCGHTYCQDYLDGILVFMEDGSAELPCPVRCTKKTTITKEQTTSSLMQMFILTSILDEVFLIPNISVRPTYTQMWFGTGHLVKNVKPICQQREKFKQIIGYSCTTCSLHSCSSKSYTNVIFNQKLQELQPLCKQHNSLAKFICIDCANLFTCVYCTHRQHKNHRIKSIDEIGLETKKWFQTSITSFDETKGVWKELTRKYGDALTNLEKKREVFLLKLKERKSKRLEEYLKILNKKEEDLLRIFDEKSKEFKAKLICDDFVGDRKLVAEKLEIEQQLRRLSSLPKTIPIFNSHLHQMKKVDFSANLLCGMKISIDDVTIVGVDPSECSVYGNLIDEVKTQPNHSQLATDLMYLVESLKEYEKQDRYVLLGIFTTQHHNDQNQPLLSLNEVKAKHIQLAKKRHSYEENNDTE